MHTRLRIKITIKYQKLKYRLMPRVQLAPRRLPARAIMIVGALVAMAGMSWFLAHNVVSAQTVTLSQADYVDGVSRFDAIQVGADTPNLSLQKGLVGSWNAQTDTGIQLPPSLTYGITNLVYGPNDTLYVMTSHGGQCYFSRYDIATQRWLTLDAPPIACGSGTILVFDGDATLYYAPGGSTSTPSSRFFSYSIRKDAWSELPETPAAVSNISDGVFVSQGSNQYVYMFRGISSPAFFRYSVKNRIWETMAPFPTSNNVNSGLVMTWDGATTIYALANGSTGEFKKYDMVTNTWAALTAVAGSDTYDRHALKYIGGKIYETRIRISNEKIFMRMYDVASGVWSALAPPSAATMRHDFPLPIAYDGSRYLYTYVTNIDHPFIVRYDVTNNTWGNSSLIPPDDKNTEYHYKLMYDGSQSVYYFAGHDTYDRLYKYDLSTKQEIQVATQINIVSGYDGAYYNNSLYLLPLTTGRAFQRYDISAGTFVPLADLPVDTYTSGADIIDGGDGYLYVMFGNNQTNFYRYNVALNTWQALGSMPRGVSSGADMARVGRKIYVLAGAQSSGFQTYNMDTATWTLLVGTPSGGVDYGGFLVSDTTRYLYAGLSSRTPATARLLYRYDTTTSVWARIADLPAGAMPHASGLYDTTNNKLYVSQGAVSPFIWQWSPNAANYVTTGTWYSKTYDLKQVETWTALDYTVTGPGTVTFDTRSSPDGNVWSAWQQTTAHAINSAPNRYLQIRVTLTGDTTTTPVVSGIAVRHTQETNAPGLPAQFEAFDKKGGAQLNTGQTYEHQHPYFSWSAADDGVNGSGVAGYYVYFGTNSGADPAVDGSYQTGLDYVVTTPMTAGDVYYVRIKVKDNLGNISPTATYFSYRYFYISPPATVLKTSTSDFTEGINSNVAIVNGSMQLKGTLDGTWSTGALSMPPEFTRGAGLRIVGDYLYVVRGNGTTNFWRYNLLLQTWENLSAVPGIVNAGSSMVLGNDGRLYLIAGNTTNAFYRYNITTNTWETLGNLPAVAGGGTEMVYIGNGKIAVLFGTVREFYIYNIADGRFDSKQAYPSGIDYGADGLWYDGNDTIYAFLGGSYWYNFSGTNRDNMVAYSIANDTWKALASPPETSANVQNNLVSDGHGGLYTMASGFFNNTTKRQFMMRYDIATDKWAEVPGFNLQSYWGGMVSDDDRYVYIFPGSNGTESRRIVRYDTWENTFTPTAFGIDALDRLPYDSPGNANAWQWIGGNASAAAYDGSKYVYAISGSESTGSWARFAKFDPVTSETVYLPPPPVIGVSGSLSYTSGKLYYLPGKSSKDFYWFDETTMQWRKMNDVPATVYRPGTSSLVTANGVLFTAIGNGNLYYQYTPDASGGTWLKMTNAPGTILNGSSVYDPTNNVIYVVAGNGTTAFYRYAVASNTWSTLANLPVASTYGSTMVMHNGQVFVQIGNRTKDSYVYTVGTNSWRSAATAPETFRYGAMAMKIDNTYAVVFNGEASPDVWKFILPDTNKAFNGLATHLSLPITTAGIYDYADVTVQVDLPAGTAVELWTRTSADGNTWDEWKPADNIKHYGSSISGHVTSTPRLYIQLKLVLRSDDNVYSPTVQSYALDYYYDIDPPTNPNTITVYTDSTKTAVLDNNTWYNKAKPLIDWPDPGEPGGAIDGQLGSNIAGYWIYFGTDPTASPRTAGVFVTSSEYEADLTIPGNYYVRIQAQDVTGNVDGNIYSPFTYKFDNQSPTNPILITVTPSGFTTQDDFTFEWPNAFDAHSGVAGYCYHTGAMSGPFAAEVCQPGKTLENVPAAYTTGTNVFYVRAYDNAGNYSPTYTTVSYYYSTDPPSQVQNLRAVPPTSPQNLFAFTWDLPTTFSGDPDLMTYCYSINVLPSELNTTCTSDRFISAFKAATQQGTNIIYVVARDEARNINWNTFASANFIANTVSPGIPLNLAVNDTSDHISNRWSLTATWDTPTFTGNGIASYIVERSLDGHTFVEIGNTSTRAFVDLDIEPEMTYYYRVRAADNVNNRGGPSAIVSRTAQGSFASPPQIVVQPKVEVGFDQAHINWATSRESTSFIYYGTTPSNIGQSKGSLELVSNHDETISGLQPSTTYYYRVQSFDNTRSYQLNDAFSPIYNFKTTEAARVYDVQVSGLTTSSGFITWRTSVPTRTTIQYGQSLGYGLVMDGETEDYSTSHSMQLTGLAGGSVYHYRITATTEFGSRIDSDDYTLETIAKPTVSDVRFQPINTDPSPAVTVSWTTNVPTSSTVRYESLGDSLETTLSELTTRHEITLRNLASSSTYTILVEGRDQYGNLVSSSAQRWTSQLDTRPPVISDVSLSVSVIDTSKGKRAQLIAIWKTDEPSTSQVFYGKVSDSQLGSKTPVDTEPTTSHVTIVSDLNLADIYKVQLVSRDLNGNTVFSTTITVVTPDKEVNVFDNILNLMQKMFSF